MLDEVTIDRRTHDLEPGLVVDHFNSADFKSMRTKMRRVDHGVIVGKWWTDLEGPYCWCGPGRCGSSAPKKTSAAHAATLHYLLTRA